MIGAAHTSPDIRMSQRMLRWLGHGVAVLAIVGAIATPALAAPDSAALTQRDSSASGLAAPAVRATAAVNGQCAANSVPDPLPKIKPLTTVLDSTKLMAGTQLFGLVEDTDGYIWVGGLNGVVRWDGSSATQVNGKEWKDPLPQIAISSMMADSNGGVWVAAGTMAHVRKDGSVVDTKVPAITVASAGDLIWAHGENQITLYDPAAAEVVSTISPAKVGAKTALADGILSVRSSVEGWLGVVDNEEHLLVIKPTGEVEYFLEDGSLQALNPDGSLTGEPLSKVASFNRREAGGFWAAVDGDLVGLDGKTTYTLPSRNADLGRTAGEISILEVPKGTGKGDLIVSPPDKGLQRLKAGAAHWEAMDVGVATTGAGFPLVDRRDILWFTDWERGVVSVLPQNRGVTGWTPGLPIPGRPTPLLDTVIVGDEVWMATDGNGLYALNRKTGSYRMLGTSATTKTFVAKQNLLATESQQASTQPTAIGELPRDDVIGLACVGDKVWAGMWNGGIAMIDPVTLDVELLTSPSRAGTGPMAPLINPDIFDITTDADGNAWVSVWSTGLQVLTPQGKALGLLAPNGDIKIQNTQPIAILPVGNNASFAKRTGQVAIGGWAGFELLDLSTGVVRRWDQQNGKLKTNLVYSIAQGDDGVFWLGTAAGLERVDTTTDQASTVLDRTQDLPGRQVLTVTRRGNQLLLGTDQGVAAATIQSDGTPSLTTVLTKQDGLSNTVMARYGKAVAPDGTVYLASSDGLTVVSPTAPRSLGIETTAQISSITIAGRPVVGSEAAVEGETFHATVGDEIGVTWKVQSYWPKEVARYIYRIGDSTGFTREPGTASTTLATTGVQVVELTAVDVKGKVLDRISLKIIGDPKWWQSWWFRSGVVVLILLGAAWYVIASRRRRQHLELLVEERTAELDVRRQQAERASREIKNLLHRISHDLRSPLNNMVGAMDLIDSTPNEERSLRSRWIGMGRAAARRLTVMLDDLIVHARAETGRALAVRLEPVLLEPVVLEAIAEAEATDLGEGRSITAVFDQTSPTLLGEREALRHLLTDVIINALSHSRPGDIVVRCADGDADNTTAISVIDPGSGLTDEELRTLTEPYRRGEQVGGVGLGLGLTVALDLARRMGGALSINADPDRTEVELLMTARTGEVRRVLIADDDPNSLMLLVASLDGSGLEVVTASNAEQLRDRLGDSNPDLLVIDHHLGPQLGADVVAAFPGRQGSQWATRVIGVSSDPGEAQADGRYTVVLEKPVTPQQLTDTIRQLSKRTQSALTPAGTLVTETVVDLSSAEAHEPSER